MNLDEFIRERDRLLRLQAQIQRERAEPRELEGEDLTSPHADDAKQWVEVYQELARFKRLLTDSIRQEAASVPQAARGELLRDERALSVELERFELHLAFWQQRLGQGGRP